VERGCSDIRLTRNGRLSKFEETGLGLENSLEATKHVGQKLETNLTSVATIAILKLLRCTTSKENFHLSPRTQHA
jgi:hypothetical protein